MTPVVGNKFHFILAKQKKIQIKRKLFLSKQKKIRENVPNFFLALFISVFKYHLKFVCLRELI